MRLEDETLCAQWLKNLSMSDMGGISVNHQGETILVEAFDKPLVAQQVFLTESSLEILMPYSFRSEVRLDSLCLDTGDRFHGLTVDDIPFVMTHKAQAEFFNVLEEFSDDSITLFGKTYSTSDFYIETPEIGEEIFWSQKYDQPELPRWDLKAPHPALASIFPQLKLLKGRFLVPGCGRGHDAHMLAKTGHIVDAVDISPLGLQTAKDLYGHQANLTFSEGDIFNWPQSNSKNYDYILEHTCFCAVSPQRRKEMVKVWSQCLDEGGHLLGIFFVHCKRGGPPYGASEKELQDLLSPYFDVRYWTRSQVSEGWRQGIELIVYAEKKKLDY